MESARHIVRTYMSESTLVTALLDRVVTGFVYLRPYLATLTCVLMTTCVVDGRRPVSVEPFLVEVVRLIMYNRSIADICRQFLASMPPNNIHARGFAESVLTTIASKEWASTPFNASLPVIERAWSTGEVASNLAKAWKSDVAILAANALDTENAWDAFDRADPASQLRQLVPLFRGLRHVVASPCPDFVLKSVVTAAKEAYTRVFVSRGPVAPVFGEVVYVPSKNALESVARVRASMVPTRSFFGLGPRQSVGRPDVAALVQLVVKNDRADADTLRAMTRIVPDDPASVQELVDLATR